MGILHLSRPLAGPVVSWRQEPTFEQIFWWDLCPCRGPMLEQCAPEGLHKDTCWSSL